MLLVLGLLLSAQAIGETKPVSAAPDGQLVFPTDGVWFGSNSPVGRMESEDHIESLLNLEEAIGRKVAVNRVYNHWLEEYPSEYDEWLRDEGRIPVLSWAPLIDEYTEVPWGEIASGLHDARIDELARAIEDFGEPMFFSFNHEPEVYRHGTSDDFIAAWRRVHGRFERVGVSNVSWTVILLAYTYRMGNEDLWYPGDDYVDVIGADGFNWHGCPGREDPWKTFDEVFSDFHDYGAAHDKSMLIGEFASMEDPDVPGRKAQWIRDATETLKSWPDVEAVTWYDNGPPESDCTWWVDSSNSSMNAFIDMGEDPYFNPPPPLVTITSGPPLLDNSLTATFRFKANVSNVTYTCKLNGGLRLPCISPHVVALPGDGEHKLVVEATDLGGKRGPTKYTWEADTTAPTLTIEGPDGYTGDPDASFKLVTGESNKVTFTCSLDGAPAAECDGPKVEYQDLADGPHTLVAKATDDAGNVSEPAVQNWTVDTVDPTVAIDSGPISFANSRTATFELSSNEPGAAYRCSLDGAEFTLCAPTKSYYGLDDGQHAFSTKAVDRAENESAVAKWTWTVDTAKPNVTITSGPVDGTQSDTATFRFNAGEPNVTFNCTLDSGQTRTCTSPKTYTGISVGEHVFSLTGTDRAGNVSAIAYWRWDRVGGLEVR